MMPPVYEARRSLQLDSLKCYKARNSQSDVIYIYIDEEQVGIVAGYSMQEDQLRKLNLSVGVRTNARVELRIQHGASQLSLGSQIFRTGSATLLFQKYGAKYELAYTCNW
ncbi:MAG: hypothetical protein Kow00121_03050 [Elainellaceae cyanobacterium]